MSRFLPALSFIAVLGVILFAGMRSEPVPQVFNHQDWLHHAAAFAALVCSARLAFPRAHTFWMVLYCLLLALLIELGQGCCRCVRHRWVTCSPTWPVSSAGSSWPRRSIGNSPPARLPTNPELQARGRVRRSR